MLNCIITSNKETAGVCHGTGMGKFHSFAVAGLEDLWQLAVDSVFSAMLQKWHYTDASLMKWCIVIITSVRITNECLQFKVCHQKLDSFVLLLVQSNLIGTEIKTVKFTMFYKVQSNFGSWLHCKTAPFLFFAWWTCRGMCLCIHRFQSENWRLHFDEFWQKVTGTFWFLQR